MFQALLERFRKPPVLDRPIFVVGCGKSGTTMLGILFSMHPDVGPPLGEREKYSTAQEFLDAMLETGSFSRAANELERKKVWDKYFPVLADLRIGKEHAHQ